MTCKLLRAEAKCKNKCMRCIVLVRMMNRQSELILFKILITNHFTLSSLKVQDLKVLKAM